MLRPLLLAFLVLGSAALPKGVVAQNRDVPPPTTGVLLGTILGEGGGESKPLPNAIVSVSAGLRNYTVTADTSGHYRVLNLPSGNWRVRAIHVGYRTLSASVRVPDGGRVTLDLSLEWAPIQLPTLLIESRPLEPLAPGESPQAAQLGEVAIRAMEGSPGMVEGGLAQVVRSLPGQDPSDPRDVLLMRGSATDLKLVLLDGAPVYTPFHMAGLVESFDPAVLGGASLFLGGAPAQFDGGLSYVLELKGRSPRMDRIRGSAAMDLLTGRLHLEGPLTSSTGFLVGARAVHNLGTPLLAGGSSPYGFGDLIGRWTWTGSGGKSAFLSAFLNQESVRLDLAEDTQDVLDDAGNFGNSGPLGGLSPTHAARWGNRALSAGYRTQLGATRAEIGLALTGYESELPLGDTLPLFAESRNDRTRLTADFSTPWHEGAIRFGASMDWLSSSTTAVVLDADRAGEENRVDLTGSSGGVYVEGVRPIGQSVSLRGGARMDGYAGDSRLRVSPRVSLTWMLTDKAALTLAAGRYHQYSNVAVQDLQTNLEGAAGGDDFASGPEVLELSVGSANHLVVSLDQALAPNLRLGLEGFVKGFDGLDGMGNGSLSASGLDLRVAKEGDRTSGWLGYTLTWFWASNQALASGDSPFSGRHLLSAGLTSALSDRTGLRLKASYGDGLPYTSIPLSINGPASSEMFPTTRNLVLNSDQILNSAPNLAAGPDEGFLRLEVELFGTWSPTISGHSMQLRPYVRVLNALNRRDALFYHFDPWRDDGPEPLADLPVLPLVGLEWRF
jgi:hypothetical protein